MSRAIESIHLKNPIFSFIYTIHHFMKIFMVRLRHERIWKESQCIVDRTGTISILGN